MHKRYLTIREALFMTIKKETKFTVIENKKLTTSVDENITNATYHSNPMYEKLMNFRNLQEQQKKRFSVEDLFKLC